MNRPVKFSKWLSTLATLLVLAPALVHGTESDTNQSSGDRPVNLLGSPTGAITPEYGLPVDAAEFSGNPAASLLSWLPEDLVIAPVPGYSPEFGWSLALLGGYFLDLDKQHPDTPPSIVGLLGWYAQNGSYAVGAGGRFNLLDDKVRIGLAAGYGDVNYRFYGIGDDAGDRGFSLRVDQQAPAAYGSVEYEFFENLYLGVGYLFSQIDTSISLELDLLPPDFPALTLDRQIAAVSFPIEYDTRDNQQFPRRGWYAQARALFYRDAVDRTLKRKPCRWPSTATFRSASATSWHFAP